MSELLTHKILQLLSDSELIDSLELVRLLKEDHQKVVGSVKSLESLGDVIKAEQRTINLVELTDEGVSIAKNGSHEALVFAAVPPGEDGLFQSELMNSVAAAVGKVGLSRAIKNGWVKTVKRENGSVSIIRVVDSVKDSTKAHVKLINEGKMDLIDSTVLADLKKRKLVKQMTMNYYHLTRGSNFTTNIDRNVEIDLTPEMLSTSSWRSMKFKSYNFDAKGVPPPSGHLHPLMKVRAEFRSILLEMGFSEMPSNQFVESSFWNFDALFVPQKHPARDAQDTFFMKNPEKCVNIPENYLKRVKDAHTGGSGNGAYGTLGYGPEWSKSESYKNCLRTHTTAVTARMLHDIGSKVKSRTDKFSAVKLFSIDRVYRNETLDATHLAEFHQVEGVIADYGINLGNLIGVMKEFFSRLGISSDKLRFKPAYNPYTEPSMEVFCYHDGLKKWVELGNSGMFRPEVLLPMGIPKNVRVIAWGLSLERPTMIRYGINNIRDLVGHKVDLKMVYDNPVCRL